MFSSRWLLDHEGKETGEEMGSTCGDGRNVFFARLIFAPSLSVGSESSLNERMSAFAAHFQPWSRLVHAKSRPPPYILKPIGNLNHASCAPDTPILQPLKRYGRVQGR